MSLAWPERIVCGQEDWTFRNGRKTGLFQRADIIPKADLGILTYVFVVAEQGDEYLRKTSPSDGGDR